MRSTIFRLAIALSLLAFTQACSPPANLYAGPGCRIDIYTLPNLQGYGLPIVRDTPELAEAWRNTASSARLVYGTWRLFSDPDYKGFMGDYTAPAEVVQLTPARELESLRCIRREPWPPGNYWSY